MAEVEIIIPNWNGREWLGLCLASLQAQTFRDFAIIIIDNHSTDGSVEFVEANFPGVRLVRLAENRGFAGGVNAGLRLATAPYVCLFNNDAEAAPDFLEQLLNALKPLEAQNFAMAAPCVMYYNEPGLINSAGLVIGIDGVARDRGFRRKYTAPLDQPAEIFGPSGVAALYRRAIFEQTGLLDDDFFLYNEDVDLNCRAQLAGYRCIYVPSATVRHHVSLSTSRIGKQAAQLASRNSLLVIAKNWPGGLLLKALPWIIAGQFYQLFAFARRGQLGAAIKGKLHFFRLLPATLAKRRTIQRQRCVTPTTFAQQLRLGRISGVPAQLKFLRR